MTRATELRKALAVITRIGGQLTQDAPTGTDRAWIEKYIELAAEGVRGLITEAER